ncbi:probable calcium permease [Rhynchosporium agropyri]|uniref:Probable calcium permease n=1 Tax=Rhynchosporium agropyri TaxID=914238 RepID=A0A1E1JRU0_9HELO|nr:probable calcium permease [Rhynchosporium agropyri]
MSGRDNNNNTPGALREIQDPFDVSAPTSPTEIRHPLARVQSISDQRSGGNDGLSESFQSTDTVRRRPEPQSYGSILQPATSHTSGHRASESSQTSDRPQPLSTESSRTLPPMRSPMLGPERGRGGQRPKKPGMPRRASSNVQAPHRGQEFSVDDDVTEIQGDLATSRQSTTGFGSTRHQPSTIRRRTNVQPTLQRVDSSRGGEEEAEAEADAEAASAEGDALPENNASESAGEGTIRDVEDVTPDEEEDEDDDLSDAESFTLKDRQEAINETHPFGIRIWKPALYKKNRSVQKTAEGDIHSSPGGRVSNWLLFFNILWTVWFGWWLALIAFLGAVVCFIFGAAPSAVEYGRVLWGLSGYLFYPFGKFVRLEQDEAYAEEDEGEGRSITEYEQWQSGDIEDGRLFFGPQGSRSIVGRSRRSIDSLASENDSLLGRSRRRSARDSSERPLKRRLFGRGEWNIGRVIYFLFFYGLITPTLFLVSGMCWFLVFWIPMGKVTMLLFYHLRRHPLALSFQADSDYSRGAIANSSILLCTYRAVGIKYWKYTVDGTNIFLINLMGVVLFVIFDYWVLVETLHWEHLTITGPPFLFTAALFSIIPLAYFIGQAVASISAQSSMGLGAAINAFFSTLVEVFLYCVALKQGKGQLVEGSIIGSIFAGILFLPGLSMCFGAIKRKTQRFNAKSAGVTSTMLLFAVIAAFGPTLFYQIYGTHELNCLSCVDSSDRKSPSRDCRRCYFSQVPALDDRFYLEAVRPYCWFAAMLLFLSYIIGLWFTLRTHAAVIWNNEVDEKKIIEVQNMGGQQQPLSVTPHGRLQRHGTTQNSSGEAHIADIRDSQLYKRILGQSLKQVGLGPREESRKNSGNESTMASGANGSLTPHIPPPKSSGAETSRSEVHIPGFTEAQNTNLVREVAEMAATAATIAAKNASKAPRRTSTLANMPMTASMNKATGLKAGAVHATEQPIPLLNVELVQEGGGHDAPNWSRTKSSIILCGATVLYALIAEILVNTVDVVLTNVAIDEKFLGITLFALVPNTTEFLNAISFAMNGNIALSMEIGSAYALQVCLLQIPALVLFSAVNAKTLIGPEHTFSLIFPQWDMVTVILCVFLLSYMYGEGKSNYFKGSILLLSYLVVIVGFYFSGMTDLEAMGASRFDIMEAGGSFKTIGRGGAGNAFQQ